MTSLAEIEKIINSDLSTKIQNSFIENDELMIEIYENELIEVIQFLKTNDKCKFRQLIDIAGDDYPDNKKRIKLIYLI